MDDLVENNYKLGLEKAEYRLGLKSKCKVLQDTNRHKYLEVTDVISGLTTRYHLQIQERMLQALSVNQLQKLETLTRDELKKRDENWGL